MTIIYECDACERRITPTNGNEPTKILFFVNDSDSFDADDACVCVPVNCGRYQEEVHLCRGCALALRAAHKQHRQDEVRALQSVRNVGPNHFKFETGYALPAGLLVYFRAYTDALEG